MGCTALRRYATLAAMGLLAVATPAAGQGISVEGVALRHGARDVPDLLGVGLFLRNREPGVVLGFQYLQGSDEDQRVMCGFVLPDDECPSEATSVSSIIRTLQVGYAMPVTEVDGFTVLLTPLATWSHVKTDMHGRQTGRRASDARGDPRLEARLDVSKALQGERVRVMAGVAVGTSLTEGHMVLDGGPPQLWGRHGTYALHLGLSIR